MKRTHQIEKDRRALLIEVRALIAGGETDQEICEQLDLRSSELKELKREIFSDEMLNTVHRPAEEVFTEYRIRQQHISHQLGELASEAKARGHYTSSMGALKARAAINTQVISVGQSMGFLPTASKTTNVNHSGIVGLTASMTDRELSEGIGFQASETKRLSEQYGDDPFESLPDEPIYTTIEEAEELPSKRGRS